MNLIDQTRNSINDVVENTIEQNRAIQSHSADMAKFLKDKAVAFSNQQDEIMISLVNECSAMARELTTELENLSSSIEALGVRMKNRHEHFAKMIETVGSHQTEFLDQVFFQEENASEQIASAQTPEA